MGKKIGLIGYGYWGPNLLRNFFEAPDCEVVYCCDLQVQRLKEVRKKYPSVLLTTHDQDLLEDSELDAIIVATPTSSHFQIAKKAVESGKDVLITKPMTINSKEADELVKVAKKNKKIVMVDHTFLFNEAVRKTKEIIESRQLGDILYIDSTRANLGLFQKDSNAIFDLASHDFSIIGYLLELSPISVQAFGKSHVNKQEDICYVIADYPKNIFVHLHLSWLSPLKIRRMIIVGTKKMLVYDDVETAEKIRLYEKGVDYELGLTKKLEEMKISYRSGDVWLPNVKNTEALNTLAREFIQAITNRRSPVSDGKMGADIVNIIEKSTISLRTGKKIFFKNANR